MACTETFDQIKVLDGSFISDLVQAAVRGDVPFVKATLAANQGQSLNQRASDGNTPLIAAIESGTWDAVTEILGRDADPNLSSASGQTPLRAAILAPIDDEYIQKLIQYGADVDGETPIGTPLLAAIGQGSISTVKLLIDSGASIDFHGTTGVSALMAAVTLKDFEMVKILLEGGADPLQRNGDGITACHLAEESQDPVLMRILVQHALDTYIQDSLQLTSARDEETADEDCISFNDEQVLTQRYIDRQKEHKDTLEKLRAEGAALRARFLQQTQYSEVT
eukprot:jgi/Botrbrau1/17741/Bobra.0127s0006.1